jgi:hypothetical protein
VRRRGHLGRLAQVIVLTGKPYLKDREVAFAEITISSLRTPPRVGAGSADSGRRKGYRELTTCWRRRKSAIESTSVCPPMYQRRSTLDASVGSEAMLPAYLDLA